MKLASALRLVRYNLEFFTCGRYRPLAVSLSVTDRCQLRCDYCRIPERNLPDPMTEQLLDIMRILRKSGCLRLAFTGGEPLLRDDIRLLARAATRFGFFTTLNTNGILLSGMPEIWPFFNLIFLSFEGMPSSQKSLRSAPSTDELIDLTARLRAAGNRVITTTILCQENYQDAGYIIDLAERHGFLADFELFSAHSLSGEVWQPSTKELFETVKFLLRQKNKGRPVANSTTNLNLLLYLLKSGRFPDRLKCFAGKLFCFIDTDGRYYPCFDLRAVNTGSADFAHTTQVQSYCDFCRCNGALELNAVYSLYPGAIRNNLAWW
ncbi:MAG: radical SAM protein [Candidatus Wallbacteria bacterium]|nr:radical SAM protein [Candidatus Wallbacteria bacterium]